MGAERMVGLSMAPRNITEVTEQYSGPQQNMCVHQAFLCMENKNGFQCESSLFTSSLSEIFNRKLNLASTDELYGMFTNTVTSKFGEDEPFESLEEIEAQTIGNLLPDDDELLSGVIDDLEFISHPNSVDDVEDDLFCSGGGMELEADGILNANGALSGQKDVLNVPFAGEHPYGEHPSRTLFVRNINSNVEDSDLRALFEQYGDIRTLYTACKHRGFVMISYYDIRSARNAMRALQNKPLRRRKLDIHFSIPKDNPSERDINQGTLVVFNLDSSVSNEDLRQIFGAYGEIKEIRETPHKHHHKFIEFYDVRAAEVALRALNRSDIAGKRIKLEPSRPGGARRLMQQFSPELEQEEANGCRAGPITLGAANGIHNGSLQVVHSTARAPFSPFVDDTFPGISSSVPHGLSSPIMVASAGNNSNQSGLAETSHSAGQVNFGLQCMPALHSHSVPEYHDVPYNSSSTMSSMAININSRPGEAVDNRHIHRVGLGGLNSQSYEHNDGAFGTSGNGSCPLHGNQYVWGNPNSFHHSPGHMMWPNSPSFLNHIPTPSQLHGFPRAPSHMLNAALPLHDHHVGSAPAVNPSLWDRRHAYAGDATNSSGFHPGSLGSVGFSGNRILHHLELASHNIFPLMGGNCIEPSTSRVGLPSPQQRCHMFHGRNHIIPAPASFDSPNDRARSRRSDANLNQADNKKQYELDIERIIRGEDSRTTLMIKNIPNKYTSKMLLAAIDEHHRGTYDFIYLPIDFKNKCNVGYAFINMIDPQKIIPFFQAFNGKKWEKFNSEKVASLAYARIQGKAALIAHFQNSSLMNEDKRCRPILFHSDGPNAGDPEPFPMGVNIRSRPGGPRTTSNEDHHQGSPSISPNGEEYSNGPDSSPGSAKDLE
uniref:Protein MEI2-like 4 n=1 Tax=Anthurium amnicola TaxID=1678845 RepID=A0A1D1YBJ9_9ARAE